MKLITLALAAVPASCVLGEITPVKVATLSVSNSINDLSISGRYLYATHSYPSPSGLTVFDVSNPAHPVDVGYVDGRTDGAAVTVSSPYAYVIYSDGLRILDISNPTNPVPAGQIAGRWTAVTVSGRYAYLTIGNDFPDIYVSIYDVSNPALPVRLGQITTGQFSRVSVSGHYAFLFNPSLLVSDVSDPNNPATLGPFGSSYYFNDLTIAGGYAYSISYTDSFRIFDISTPTNPACIYRSGWQPFPQRVLVSGNYVYLLCGLSYPDFIPIYDVSIPTNASIAGSIPPAGYYPTALTVSGNYAFVACYPGLLIYSLGIPPPRLSITYLPTSALVLSWPAPTGGFLVQETSDLTAPNWATLRNTPAVVGTNNQVTVPVPVGSRFYRLVSP